MNPDPHPLSLALGILEAELSKLRERIHQLAPEGDAELISEAAQSLVRLSQAAHLLRQDEPLFPATAEASPQPAQEPAAEAPEPALAQAAETPPKAKPEAKPEPEPEPEPAPAPAPEQAPAPEPPKPSARDITRIRRLYEHGLEGIRSAESMPEAWPFACEIREAISLTERFIDEELTHDAQSARDEAKLVMRSKWGSAPCLPLDDRRRMTTDLWREMAAASRAAVEARNVLNELRESDQDELWRDAFVGASDGQAWLNRILSDSFGVLGSEEWLKEIFQGLRDIQPDDLFVASFRVTGPDRMPHAELRASGERFLTRGYADQLTKGRERRRREQLEEELVEFLDNWTPRGDENFSSTLRDRLLQSHADGVSFRKAAIRDRLEPYLDLLEEMEDAPLTAAARDIKTAMVQRQLKANRTGGAPSPRVNPALLAKARALVGGKIMAILGGRKGQADRLAMLKEELGLTELIWPDMEDASNVNQLSQEAARADVVCYLIRFSRHSYKMVLDEAKDRGAATVTLPAGLSLAQFCHHIVEQAGPAPEGQ